MALVFQKRYLRIIGLIALLSFGAEAFEVSVREEEKKTPVSIINQQFPRCEVTKEWDVFEDWGEDAEEISVYG